MKSLARPALAAVIAVLLSAVPATAAQIVMKVHGVRGPLVHDGEPGWFRVNSFHWGTPSRPLPANKPPRPGPGTFVFTTSRDYVLDDLLLVGETRIPMVKMHYLWPGSRENRIEFELLNVWVTDAPDRDEGGPERWLMKYSSIRAERKTPGDGQKSK